VSTSSSPALRLAEAGLAAAGAAVLGGAVGLIGGVPLGIAAGTSAGLNGALGGYRQIYDWRAVKGWFAFAADSTWGLLGTTLGNVLVVANLAGRHPGYRPDFSRRQNRQVFEKGAFMRRGFAVTHGNVISNAAAGRESLIDEHRPFIDRHEGLHIWQSRIFGPIYQLVYVVWFAGGVLVGAATWALKKDKPRLKRLVETAAYYDNPFEFWAYKHDEHWKNNSADPTLKWHRPQWPAKRRTRADDGPRRARPAPTTTKENP
jgi:hypothetical protein